MVGWIVVWPNPNPDPEVPIVHFYLFGYRVYVFTLNVIFMVIDDTDRTGDDE